LSPSIARTPALIAASLWAAAAVLWLTFEAITASAFPGYSYATNYISDLGVPEVAVFEGRTIDSPLSALMNVAFIAQGILLLAGVGFALRATRAVGGGARTWILSIAIIHAVGMLLVGIFHGSQTNLENGLLALHGLGAALAIISGNVTAILVGIGSRHAGARPWYRSTSIVLGIVGLVCLVMLLVTSSTSITTLPEAVWERGSVYSIVGWELFTAISLIAGTRRRSRLA
jgi:hypothetical membrane protein